MRVRSRALLMIVVVGTAPALADKLRGRPVLVERRWTAPLPPVVVEQPIASRPVITIAPETPMRARPWLAARERLAIEQVAAHGTGAARVAALDSLIGALEHDLDLADDGGTILEELTARSQLVISERALARYPHAAEVMVRAARWIAMVDPAGADRVFVQVLAKHPRSPFAADAHLALAGVAEVERRYAEAKVHFEAVIATGRPAFAAFARLRLAWITHLAGDSVTALKEISALAESHRDLREVIAERAVAIYAKAGAAVLARAYFERLGVKNLPERLRALADGYANHGRALDAVTARRAAMALDGDRIATCRDRAAIVIALAGTPNRSDAELAVAELVEAKRFAGAGCAREAEAAVTGLAVTWHHDTRRAEPLRTARMWARVSELATTENATSLAHHNRAAMYWEAARVDRRVASWIAAALAAEQAALADVALGAWSNAITLGPSAQERAQIRTHLAATGALTDRVRALLEQLP